MFETLVGPLVSSWYWWWGFSYSWYLIVSIRDPRHLHFFHKSFSSGILHSSLFDAFSVRSPFFRKSKQVNLNQYHRTVASSNTQNLKLAKLKNQALFYSTLFKNFHNSFLLLFFCMILIEMVIFINILSLKTSGIV